MLRVTDVTPRFRDDSHEAADRAVHSGESSAAAPARWRVCGAFHPLPSSGLARLARLRQGWVSKGRSPRTKDSNNPMKKSLFSGLTAAAALAVPTLAVSAPAQAEAGSPGLHDPPGAHEVK